MRRYVEVPRASMLAFLESKGFREVTTIVRCRELVYERAHDRKPALRVRVFTSISRDAATARDCGADSIRVVLVSVTKTSVGIHSATKVLRTGSVERVLDRTCERMRECYAIANRTQVCRRCGAATYEDSGRCVDRSCRETAMGATR